MKRLILTGLACPPEAWTEFLGERSGQKIISLYDVFENSTSSDLRQMSRYVTDQIASFKPDSIIAHDLGVPLCLLGLWRLEKCGVLIRPKLTLFNSAFRKLDIFRARHAFRIQFIGARRAINEIQSRGGRVDLRLKKHFSRIRAMYRYIILYGVGEKLISTFGMEDILDLPKKLAFKSPVQMIVSRNDPYVPYDAIRQLKADCRAERLFEIDYGHFPYTASRRKVLPLIEEFERH